MNLVEAVDDRSLYIVTTYIVSFTWSKIDSRKGIIDVIINIPSWHYLKCDRDNDDCPCRRNSTSVEDDIDGYLEEVFHVLDPSCVSVKGGH